MNDALESRTGIAIASSTYILGSIDRKTKTPEFSLFFCVGTNAIVGSESQCPDGLLVCMPTTGRDLDPNRFEHAEYKRCGDLTKSNAILVRTIHNTTGWWLTKENHLYFSLNSPSNGYFKAENHGKSLPATELQVLEHLREDSEFCVRVDFGQPELFLKTPNGTNLAPFDIREDPKINIERGNPGGSLHFNVYGTKTCAMAMYFYASEELHCANHQMEMESCDAHPDNYLCTVQLKRASTGFVVRFKGVPMLLNVPEYVKTAVRHAIDRYYPGPEKTDALNSFGYAGSGATTTIMQFMEAGKKIELSREYISCYESDYIYLYDTSIFVFSAKPRDELRVFIKL
ncbi:hypothetical protein DdX_14167 [Ditylenchus destructor]|uniref:Uncharacterized protein n=1 Tax=Ditylenchus destructor TaxID=166010 RepID=A0AAD4MUY6_9BILA|nr:hypothetical protein DdX_14167 [Ditylenchus destructor]